MANPAEALGRPQSNAPAPELPRAQPALTRTVVLVAGTVAILLGAFLLFSVQPLVGKIVLPRFGGSAAVWSICLVFFQTALLGGYAFAYALARFTPKRQTIAYAVICIVAAVVSSIPLGDAWQLTWFENPAGELLLKLTRFVALPCLLLSSVSILVQVWSRLVGVKDPYAFYAVSNVGSLGALLAYPTLIEPNLSVPASAAAWTWGFRLLAVLLAGLALVIFASRTAAPEEADAGEGEASPGWPRTLAWIFLSAIGSGLLVSFTSRMTQDIAPIPMLWIIPLSLYLLTFIICFSHRQLYRRELVAPLALVAFAVHTFVALKYSWSDLGFNTKLLGVPIAASGATVGIAISSLTFFTLVLLLHGELYTLRPAPRFLSRFYLAISTGGALGGVFVTLLAPFLFKVQLEYPILLACALGLLLFVTVQHRAQLLQDFGLNLIVTVAVTAIGLWTTTAKMLAPEWADDSDSPIVYYRNIYGPMRVEGTSRLKSFIHAGTVHGTQLTAPDAEQRPISYYGEQSAFGVVYDLFVTQEKRNPLKIGAIGLGTGTLATYSRGRNDMSAFEQDGQERSVTFYEIDPAVAEIARAHFTYLPKARGDVAIHFGDARTTLERQPPQQFDMLLVDAFTGDGIPIHLLTREALELYRRHIKPDGAILFHVSNHYLRLEAVVANTADALGLQAWTIGNQPEAEALDNSDYVVVSAQSLPLESKDWDDGAKTIVRPTKPDPQLRVWTDDYSNLFSVLIKD